MINPAVFFLADMLLSDNAHNAAAPYEMAAYTHVLDYSQLFQWISAFDLTFEILFLCIVVYPSFLHIYGKFM